MAPILIKSEIQLKLFGKAQNRLFLGFVEKKVVEVSKLANNEIRWVGV